MNIPQSVSEVNQHVFLIMISASFALSCLFCFHDFPKYTNVKHFFIDIVGYGIIFVGSSIVIYTVVLTTLIKYNFV